MSNRNTPKNFIDLSGKKFWRLTVLHRDVEGQKKSGVVIWRCRCDCGKIISARGASIKNGNTKSCGCLKLEILETRSTVHGLSGGHGKYTRLYQVWLHMRCRCLNKNSADFKYYGGRGIGVCKEWDSFAIFHDWAMGSGYKNDLTLDRINNEEGYFPENCRWATRKQQSRNKRNLHMITFNGKTMSIAEWEDELGLGCISHRLHLGWTEEEALSIPKGQRRKRVSPDHKTLTIE